MIKLLIPILQVIKIVNVLRKEANQNTINERGILLLKTITKTSGRIPATS